LKQRFREKTRSLASQILAEWSKTAKKYKVIKHQSLIMAIKRGGRMKKLIWKVLGRNAKVRKTERNETKFAALCFYQLVVKRSLKAFRLYG
jgi:transcription antitermination factor NusA-like protein